MAAWRIARAWQAYKRSPARTAKLQAAECLQAACRGVAARRLAQQLRLQQQLLVELQQALQQGQQAAVQQAAERARAAGALVSVWLIDCTVYLASVHQPLHASFRPLPTSLRICHIDFSATVVPSLTACAGVCSHVFPAGCGAEVDQALVAHSMSMSTAVQQLQHAAGYGNHAAYTAAAAIAGRFPGLQEQLSSCKQVYDRRRQAAEQALAAAVASLPLAQVQGAVDVALQLGLPGKQLAAALDAARARDAAAAARVAAAVKAAAAAVQTACHLTSSISSSSESTQHSRTCGQPEMQSTCFDVQGFEEAVTACQQLGVTCDVATARRSIVQYRAALEAQLAAAVEHPKCAAVLEQIMQVCRGFGGLEQQIAAASGKLEQQRQQLVLRLQQHVGLAAAPAAACAIGTAGDDTGGGSSAIINYAQVQQLLGEAAQLGIGTDVTGAVQQRLQAAQEAAAAQLHTAAETGSTTTFQQAVAAARKQGVEERQVQQAQQCMQTRKVDAAAQLAGAAAAAAYAAHAELSSGGLANNSSLQDMLSWVQLALKACSAAVEGSCGSMCIHLPSPACQQHHMQNDGCVSAEVPVQQLWQHVQDCVQLGLASNVLLALQAVAAACKAGLHEGKVAACGWLACTQRKLLQDQRQDSADMNCPSRHPVAVARVGCEALHCLVTVASTISGVLSMYRCLLCHLALRRQPCSCQLHGQLGASSWCWCWQQQQLPGMGSSST
jgi:hypothetical protein